MNVYEIILEPTRLTEGRDHDVDVRDGPGPINFGGYTNRRGAAE
jgi:hypothetical protein